VAEDRAKSGFVPMRQLVQESFPKIEKLFEHSSPITGVGCHLPDLDRMTRGFQPGDLVIVAARPSMGKTSLVLNICQHVATHTAPGGGRQGVAGVFSLEMSKEQLFMRMLSSEAKIDSYRLMSGQIGQREYAQITHAMETLSEAQLFIDDSAGIGVLEMRAKARRLQAEHGLDVLAVDYVQLMTGRGRFENRTLELAAISRSLKGLAKELGIPILVLSQLSRAPEARSDKRPQLSDLRESGALEQDADLVIMIFREEMYKVDKSVPSDVDGIAELIIAKQRNGPTGTVKTAFISGQTKFMPLAGGGGGGGGE
jgi:replicative DNA helicase